MSSTKIYDFETETEYNFDTDDYELVAGKAQLKKIGRASCRERV